MSEDGSGLLPDDPHDRALLESVHPPDWSNPKPASRYNLVVIGAGTAGLVAAAGAAGLGARVALVERRLMGGDCLNFGCVPSKAILASAHALDRARTSGGLGLRVQRESLAPDFPAVMRRMREIRARISPADSASRFRDQLGVDVFFGDASFVGSDSVEVDGRKLRFKKAVIASGARPFVPPIPGLEAAGYYTNETIFSLTELPERLLIVGGGPIGCELAQAFARMGSRVTIVELAPRFLAREDPDAASLLRAQLEQDGIEIALGTSIEGVEVGAASKRVRLLSGDESREVEADAILVGAGRVPNVEGLALERAGIEASSGGVTVDDALRTTNANVFAAGDVCMTHKFTHAADFAARAVVQNALFFGRKKLSALTIPWCTYTQPEIAQVGLDERLAAERGVAIDTYRRDFDDVDRAIAEGDEVGFVKIHCRKGKDTIVGATIVSSHAGEMISELSVAMAGGVGLSKLASVIHPYPTRAEAIRQLGDQYNRTRLTPAVSFAFKALLRLRR